MRQSGIRTSGSPAEAATVSERGAAALAHVRGSVSLTAHASVACCLILVLAATAGAQGQLTPIIRVELRPAALPSPALRYHLLPHLSEQTPGDGTPLYMQAITAKKQTDGNGQEAA